MLRPLCVLALCLPAAGQEPATRPESSGHAATSSSADVARFVDALVRLPHGDRLTVEVAGKTAEGRAQLLVKAALPPAPGEVRLRALVIGNIHAGECDGKEALLLLLREFARGEHEELLRRVDVHCLPIYNVDGNERVSRRNRPGQNGPPETGQRANAQGLDLNRDFVKADAPETRTLLGLFARLDPHLFVDLHTTNGSRHGYHVTFAPCLSPNLDPGIARLSRALLDGAAAGLRERHGMAAFDYGNFATRDWDGAGSPESAPGVRGWYSYDHRPRCGVNYFGLRNRAAVLVETYSYCDFATRIAAARGFVLALLHGLGARADLVRRECAAADRRLVAPGAPVYFGSDTAFGPPELLPVLVGEVEQVDDGDGGPPRFVRAGDGTAQTMPVFRSFLARRQRALPAAWAVVEPSPETVAALQAHGVEFTAVTTARQVAAERFAVAGKRKPRRPFQGHQELVLDGAWAAPAATTLLPGTLLVPGRQRFARLAAQLLEPESEDSLSTWNFLEAGTTGSYPVLRVVGGG
ncbi:MAG: hypothetical protein FJ265_12460 [Planctomycetes bacterium]|nr:hypothetical protein [Planctomycetota bacterium]